LRCGVQQLATAALTQAVPFSRNPVWGAWVVINARVCELPPGCMVNCEVVARWAEKGGGEVTLGSGRLALFAPYYMLQGNLEIVINHSALASAAAGTAPALIHVAAQHFTCAVFHPAAVDGVAKICQIHDCITRFKEGRQQQQQQHSYEQQQLSSLGLLYRHSPALHPPPPPSPHQWLHALNLIDAALFLAPSPQPSTSPSPSLSSSSSSATATTTHPSLTAEDQNYIWCQRRSILGVSHALPAVVQSTPWLCQDAVLELHSLLPQWSPMRESLLLLLLQDSVTDIVARTWACLCLSSIPLTRLPLLLPSIISTLRYEPVAGIAPHAQTDIQPLNLPPQRSITLIVNLQMVLWRGCCCTPRVAMQAWRRKFIGGWPLLQMLRLRGLEEVALRIRKC
jgi:hypothetical protein